MTTYMIYDKMFQLIQGSENMRVIIKIIMSPFRLLWWILRHIIGYLFGFIPNLKKNMTGDEFEEYVCEILKRNGYKQVKLTRRTGDYGVDILASDKHYRYAIQCKYYNKPVGVSAVQQAYSGCQYYECDIPVVVTNHTFTSQAQKLAVTNGVKLWDGEILKRMKAKANAKSLFHRFPKESHPYASIIHLIFQEGYASDELLHEHLDMSLFKAYYILDDLEFYDLVSKEDEYGIRELYFESEEEALEKLDF